MYGWLWRHLPRPLPLRLVTAAALLAAVLLLLFLVVFPAVEPHLPFSHVTVTEPGTATASAGPHG